MFSPWTINYNNNTDREFNPAHLINTPIHPKNHIIIAASYTTSYFLITPRYTPFDARARYIYAPPPLHLIAQITRRIDSHQLIHSIKISPTRSLPLLYLRKKHYISQTPSSSKKARLIARCTIIVVS